MTPTIQTHAHATNKTHIVVGWLTKLTPNQRLFQFILYVKHDNVIMYDIFL
jgi:cell division inhibitor SulA